MSAVEPIRRPAPAPEPAPGRERIDMAFFGAAPDFVRASIHLRGIDGSRSAAQARALLAKASSSPGGGSGTST